MHESHDLNGPRDTPEALFEARLRNVRPAPPRLDRDRLMYLAGRKSAAPARRSRLWPFVAAVSWTTCAALAGLLVTQPPKVIVETRFVERVIEKPVVDRVESPPDSPRSVVSAKPPSIRAGSAIERDAWALGPIDGPLSVLSSRPSFRPRGDDLASADPPTASAADIPRSPPASYGDLRRELLPESRDSGPSAGLFRWF